MAVVIIDASHFHAAGSGESQHVLPTGVVLNVLVDVLKLLKVKTVDLHAVNLVEDVKNQPAELALVFLHTLVRKHSYL